MSAMSIRLPDSLHRNARAYAEREGVSVNQLVATALAEKLAALGAEDYLRSRAQRGTRDKFALALASVPADPPVEGDALPRSTRPARRRGG
jgi:hypothetical protein